MSRISYDLMARHSVISLGQSTKIMGIVNLTPDSFSKDGHLAKGNSLKAQERFALRLVASGADIVDVGGESTRPGAKPVSAPEEIKRVVSFIESFHKKSAVPISIDTYKTEVAKAALDAGAVIVNNIQGSRAQTSLLKMVKAYDAAIVLMHMRGNPQTMQKKTQYNDVVKDVIKELKIALEKCLEIGIKKDRIIIDPGIGFAKTAEQNFLILKCLNEFHQLKLPLLVGTSRKSFIGHVLNKDVDGRLMGTAATAAAAIIAGAHIIRVHDVEAIKQVSIVTDEIINAHN
jgi:dihydropteroate synthase